MNRRMMVIVAVALALTVFGVSCRRRPIIVVRPPLPTMPVSPTIPTVPTTTAMPQPSSTPSPKQQVSGGGGGQQGGGSQSSDSSEGGGGSSTTSTSSGLPKGFPSQFPIPPGNRAVASAQTDGVVLSVWFAGPQRQDQLWSYFRSELPAAGWKITPVATASGPIRSGAVYAISGHGWSGNLAIGEGFRAAAGYEGVFSFFVRLAH